MFKRLIEIIGLFIIPFYMVGSLFLSWGYALITFVPLVFGYFICAPIYYIVTGECLADNIYAEKLIKGILYPIDLFKKGSNELFNWVFKDFKYL